MLSYHGKWVVYVQDTKKHPTVILTPEWSQIECEFAVCYWNCISSFGYILERLSDVFQNIFFCDPLKNRNHTGLEQREGEWMMTEFKFLGEWKLKMYSPAGHRRCRQVYFFMETEIEHYITCSPMDPLQWMGAVIMRVQTADQNNSLTSCEVKCCMFLKSKSIKAF